MTKSNLVNILSKVFSTRQEAKKAVDVIFSSMADALKRGEKVTISNFGSFRIRITSPRKIKLPRDSKEIYAVPRKMIKFKPAKKILDSVNAR